MQHALPNQNKLAGFLTNQEQGYACFPALDAWWHIYVRFPALDAGGMFLLQVLIGSLRYLRLL